MNSYCHLARQAIEWYLKNGAMPKAPIGLPPEFYNRRCGVFVTLEKNDQLRGCIGTCLPTKENLAQEIIDNAIAAATKDTRFNPVTFNELDQLSFTVYLLTPLQPISNFNELNPKKYGILVKSLDNPYKSGLLLPDLKGIETTEQQIVIACQKAGIDPERERLVVYKFEVEKHSD